MPRLYQSQQLETARSRIRELPERPPKPKAIPLSQLTVRRSRRDASLARHRRPRLFASSRRGRRQVNFDEAFLRLNGREPTGEEKRDALMLQDVVRSADLDPVLLVFLALGKYETLYRQGVQRITTAVEEAALQAAAIGERVGRERAEQAAVEATIRKLAAAIERRSTPAHQRTKQLAFGLAIAVIVAAAILVALAMGRVDGTLPAHTRAAAPQWLPSWGWLGAGIVLAEAFRQISRPLLSRKWIVQK